MSEEVVVKRDNGQDELLSLANNMDKIMSLADHFRASGVYPNIENKYMALAIVEAGRELGLPPIMAFQTIYPIKGRLTMSAGAMLSIFQKNGGKTKVVERTATRCEIEFSKFDREPGKFSFTIEEAKQAGLTGKDNWKSWPADMLFARCVTRGIKSYDPGCTLGLSSTEEIQDLDGGPGEAPPAVKVEPYAPPTKPEPEKPKAAPAKVIEAEVVKPAAEPAQATEQEKAAEDQLPLPTGTKPEPKAEPKPAGELKARAIAMMDTLYKKHNVIDIYPRVAARLAALHGLKSMEGTEVDEKMTEADAENILPILEKYITSPSKAKKSPAPAKAPAAQPDEAKV